MDARKVFTLIAAGLAPFVLLQPTPASATPPSEDTVQVHVDLGIVGTCGAFDVRATFEATRRITTFYDVDGTPIRQHVHAEIPGLMTNTVTGKSLASTGVRNITRDLITGEFKSTATNVHVIVPGQGTVQLASGLVSIDEFGNVRQVGRQDSDVTPALCQALS